MPEALALSNLLEEGANVLRFGLAGLANTLFGGAIIFLLAWGCGANPFVANAAGIAAGLVLGFMLNRFFVFQSERTNSSIWRYGVTIALAFSGSQLVLAATRSSSAHGDAKAVAAQVTAMAAYTAINFILCRLWVFREARASTAGRL